jgi:hypothetical protein
MDEFYNDLQDTLQGVSSHDMLMVIGDFNAKVGQNWQSWNGVIGKFGIGSENDRGERLLQFCQSNNLVITNTMFKQTKPQRQWTWTSPDGQTKNMIDFVLVNRRWKSNIKACRSFAAEVGSDHKLVLATIRSRINVNSKIEHSKKIDIDKLNSPLVKSSFRKTMQEKITSRMHGAMNVEETWNCIKTGIMQAAEEVLGCSRRKKKTQKWITQEVLNLSDERRKLSANKNQNATSRNQYNRLTRQIKLTAKRDKNNWIAEQCEEAEIFAERNETRELYRKIKELSGKTELKMSSIKGKDGHVIQGEEATSTRWKEYFQELYNVQNTVDETVLDELPTLTETEQFPTFIREEIKASVESLKKRKAPGNDNISAELLQAGGEYVVDALLTLFNKIHEKTETPREWGEAIIVPIFKKGDKSECKNYRGISLLSVPGKVFTKTLQRRMKKYVEEAVAEEQAGFRPGRGTVDQIFTIRQISEKFIEYNQTCYNNFIDFKQAFDSIWQKGLWQVLRMYGVPDKLCKLVEDIYNKSVSSVRIDRKLTDWFKTTVGVRQGCTLSPDLFNLVLEAVMALALQEETAGVQLCGRTTNNLRFADDIDLVTENMEDLQRITTNIDLQSKRFGLNINTEKTKVMSIGKEHEDLQITVGGNQLEQVPEFVYLGAVISEDGSCEADIKRRIGLAAGTFGNLTTIWKAKNITIKTKVKVYETMVVPILLYGSECWSLKKTDERKIQTAEMSWLRRMIGISRLQRIRNEVIRKHLGQETSLVHRIQERRLKWFGHVSRMSQERLPYVALHTKIHGQRIRGRPRRRWIDTISQDLEQKGLSMNEVAILMPDRNAWRKVIRPHRHFKR